MAALKEGIAFTSSMGLTLATLYPKGAGSQVRRPEGNARKDSGF
jgi:hypothetical protein